MFWFKLVELCNERNISPNKVCSDLGLSTAIATKWKNGSAPRSTTLQKIADYFGVTTDYLIKDEEKHKIEIEGSILTIFSQLSEEKQKEALSYLRFLAEKRDN